MICKHSVIVVLTIICMTAITLGSKIENGTPDTTFVLQETRNGEKPIKLIIITWDTIYKGQIKRCKLLENKDQIRKILGTVSDTDIKLADKNEFESILQDCSEISRRGKRDINNESRREISQTGRRQNNKEFIIAMDRQNSKKAQDEPAIIDTFEAPTTEETPADGYDGWNVIFPGTKWCGAGDKADNFDDLGLHAETDKCCRAHDLCNGTMAPGETRNSLTNSSPFTKLSCKCDDDFYNCLDRVDSMISNKIGNVYFNILRRDCYKEDYPLTKKCKTFRSFLKITCKEYEKNTKAPKIYQWVSPRMYKKLPFPGPLTITLPF